MIQEYITYVLIFLTFIYISFRTYKILFKKKDKCLNCGCTLRDFCKK